MKNFLGILFIFSLFQLHPVQAQNKKIEQLESELPNLSKAQKWNTMIDLMWEYRDIAPEKTLTLGNALIQDTKSDVNFKNTAKVLNLMGVAHRNLGNYTEALDFYKHALLQSDILNDTPQKGYAYINIGNLFYFQGNQYEALKNMKEALIISQKEENNSMIGYCYMNLGDIQLSAGKYDIALENYNKAREARLSINDTNGIAVAEFSIGKAFLNGGNPHLARSKFLIALEEAQKADYKSLEYKCYEYIGLTYTFSSQDSLSWALENYDKAYEGFLELQQPLGQAKVLIKKADVEFSLGNYNQSIIYASSGLAIAEKLPAVFEALQLSEILVKTYHAKGNLMEENRALKDNLKYLQLFNDTEKLRKAQMLDNSIQLSNKEKEIDKLNYERKISNDQIKNQQYFIIALFVVFALFAIILYLLNLKSKRFRQFSLQLTEKAKEIQKQKVIIDQKALEEHELNEKLLEKNIELMEALEQSKKMFEQLEKNDKLALLGQMMAVVAHEINNPTNFIYNNVVPIQDTLEELLEFVNGMDEVDEEKVEDIEECKLLLDGIQDGVKRIMDISAELKNVVKSNHGFPKPYFIHENLDTTLNLLHKKYKYDDIEVIKEYDLKVEEITCLGGKISQIFINLIDNAYQAVKEHTPEGGFIKIRTNLLKDRVGISIIDNGGGIKDLDHLFETFFTTKKDGLGLGLMICKDIIKQHKGEINAFNNKEGGATFSIQLPLKFDDSDV
ncbi:tetratricopeptide repeat-containing sensor histidine kinase [Flammeovirga aprica]|uniref:histidine kinase n=1 Tax=Flammeovirga aprica JL-4 TaxID=694437 RepID=A0A7X9RV40_9BACT|nr:tetratricopeptide repeat protein [Flammeovirga aprica]NME69288.1 tetratricopeptide repeat protein [Flammeovirga aprica JL-4]